MPEGTSLNNCGNCSKDPNCEKEKKCLCHSVEIYSKFPHIIHRPAQLVEQEDNFKAAQIGHLKQRFPQLTEKEIMEMYQKNLYT